MFFKKEKLSLVTGKKTFGGNTWKDNRGKILQNLGKQKVTFKIKKY